MKPRTYLPAWSPGRARPDRAVVQLLAEHEYAARCLHLGPAFISMELDGEVYRWGLVGLGDGWLHSCQPDHQKGLMPCARSRALL